MQPHTMRERASWPVALAFVASTMANVGSTDVGRHVNKPLAESRNKIATMWAKEKINECRAEIFSSQTKMVFHG